MSRTARIRHSIPVLRAARVLSTPNFSEISVYFLIEDTSIVREESRASLPFNTSRFTLTTIELERLRGICPFQVYPVSNKRHVWRGFYPSRHAQV